LREADLVDGWREAPPGLLPRLPAGPIKFKVVSPAGSATMLMREVSGRFAVPVSFSMIVLNSHLVVAVADGIPNYDIVRSCKLDAAATVGLALDQSIKSCVSDEQTARKQLAGQWSKFPASSRASCASQENIGGTPSYVSLLTCLQMGQWGK
jgi:hypothetical protein